MATLIQIYKYERITTNANYAELINTQSSMRVHKDFTLKIYAKIIFQVHVSNNHHTWNIIIIEINIEGK